MVIKKEIKHFPLWWRGVLYISEASKYAEKIRNDIERIIIKDAKSGLNLQKITASFGVAEYFKETPDAFVEKADSALYKAKENGRNRVEIH